MKFLIPLFFYSILVQSARYYGHKPLSTPYTQIHTFTTSTLINTGPIPGTSDCTYIIGSVNAISYSDNAINHLMGDSQGLSPNYLTSQSVTSFNSDATFTPVLNFGSKMVIYSKSGQNDNYYPFFGDWRFMMIPLKTDGSFDIVPNAPLGITGTHRIAFNLIACF